MKKKSLKIILVFSFIILISCVYWIYNKNSTTGNNSSISKIDSGNQSTAPAGDTLKPGKVSKKYSTKFKKSNSQIDDDNVSAIFDRFISFRRQPTSEAVKVLSEYLKHPNSAVAEEALSTLGVIGLKSGLHEIVYKIVTQKALDREFAFRGRALSIAALIGKERSLPLIAEFISENNQNPDSTGYKCASGALSRINTPACLPYLNTILSGTGNQRIHRNCFETLARIATPEAINILEKYLFSSDNKDQALSALALTRLNSSDCNRIMADGIKKKTFQDDTINTILSTKAAPDIVNMIIKDNTLDAENRVALLKTIAGGVRSGSLDTREEVSSIIGSSLLNGSKEPKNVKLEAIKTISGLGGLKIADDLIPELENTDSDIRRAATLVFATYADSTNYTSLFNLLWDDDVETRRTAMFTIQRFATNADQSILKELVDHEDEYIRKQAKQLLDSLS
jgi:HEAT repeat protein